MKNFTVDENIGLIIKKRHNDKLYNHIFVSSSMVDKNFLGGQSYIFPLWINRTDAEVMHDAYDKRKRYSNLNVKFETLLESTYNKKNITEQIFYYIYAVLYSKTYRASFPEQLQIDYPKIPITKDVKVFEQLSALGKELSDLHLLKSIKLNKPQVKFQGLGNGKVENAIYDKNRNVITINGTQFFDNIGQSLWDYEIGKNRVIQQWIKNKEKIEFEDAVEFGKIATAIYETFNLQIEIDKIYPEILTELIEKQ